MFQNSRLLSILLSLFFFFSTGIASGDLIEIETRTDTTGYSIYWTAKLLKIDPKTNLASFEWEATDGSKKQFLVHVSRLLKVEFNSNMRVPRDKFPATAEDLKTPIAGSNITKPRFDLIVKKSFYNKFRDVLELEKHDYLRNRYQCTGIILSFERSKSAAICAGAKDGTHRIINIPAPANVLSEWVRGPVDEFAQDCQ